jgi:hypothetical protein
LFDNSYCCIASRKHLHLRRRISIDQLMEAQHISVSSGMLPFKQGLFVPASWPTLYEMPHEVPR